MTLAVEVPSCPSYLPSLSKVRHQGLLPLFTALIALELWIALDAIFPNPTLLAFAAHFAAPFHVHRTDPVLAKGLRCLKVIVPMIFARVDVFH